MEANANASITSPAGDDFLATLLRGYRFSVCETPAEAARALDVRRAVYVDGSGYRIPVPDRYDARSWFLLAEDLETGRPVGSMRFTPRSAGPLECEEYFTLPRTLAVPGAIELNRFAILPAYRKGKTFLPIVTLGLFKLVMQFLKKIDADWMVIASRPERVWTYEWIRFQRTGLTAAYAKLDYCEHELLSCHFRRIEEVLAGHPFYEFFVEADCPEVVQPTTLPPLGLGIDRFEEPLTLRASA